MTKDLSDRLRREATLLGVSLSDLMREKLTAYVMPPGGSASVRIIGKGKETPSFRVDMPMTPTFLKVLGLYTPDVRKVRRMAGERFTKADKTLRSGRSK